MSPLHRLIVACTLSLFTLTAYGERSPGVDDGAARSTAETTFVRIAEDERGRPSSLQAAVARYVMAAAGGVVTVDLVSALHVADRPYFGLLNQRFGDYDVLLYELIAPPGATIDREQRPTGLLSRAQLAMTAGLGLSFQLEEIDYTADNFVHADLSHDELAAAMKARGETPLLFLWRIFSTAMRESARDPMGVNGMAKLAEAFGPRGSESLKITMARELTNMGQLQDVLGDDSSSSIIGARNERAIEVLRQSIEAGATRIGIFYGAAHMPDMERRLVDELGLTYEGSEWLDAWQLTGQ